jgi:hypothetical protein
MNSKELLERVKNTDILFSEVLSFIDSNYEYSPSAFKNGDQYNEATQNQGSAKVLYFAHLNQLNKEDTLSLFAEHYQNVLENPASDNHQNIRQFMQHGWDGVEFKTVTLK